MLNLIKIKVPAAKAQDSNQGSSVWVDGKLRILRGSNFDTFLIKHESREVDYTVIENGKRKSVRSTAVYAFPIQVEKPVTYDMVIDAAERAAYNLRSDREANSFSASLSRKARVNGKEDPEVVEHDAFIEEVKADIKPLFK